MLDLVGTGGGGSPITKAARDVVAGYLNAARFGGLYQYSEAEISAMWTAAVANNTFKQLHSTLAPFNELGCPSIGAAMAPRPVVTFASNPLWTWASQLRLFVLGSTAASYK
jgi:hypothetical protein